MSEKERIEQLRSVSIRATLEKMQAMEIEMAALREEAAKASGEAEAAGRRWEGEFVCINMDAKTFMADVVFAVFNTAWLRVLKVSAMLDGEIDEPEGEGFELDWGLTGVWGMWRGGDVAPETILFMKRHRERAARDGETFCGCGHCDHALRILRLAHPAKPCPAETKCVLEAEDAARAKGASK